MAHPRFCFVLWVCTSLLLWRGSSCTYLTVYQIRMHCPLSVPSRDSLHTSAALTLRHMSEHTLLSRRTLSCCSAKVLPISASWDKRIFGRVRWTCCLMHGTHFLKLSAGWHGWSETIVLRAYVYSHWTSFIALISFLALLYKCYTDRGQTHVFLGLFPCHFVGMFARGPVFWVEVLVGICTHLKLCSSTLMMLLSSWVQTLVHYLHAPACRSFTLLQSIKWQRCWDHVQNMWLTLVFELAILNLQSGTLATELSSRLASV